MVEEIRAQQVNRARPVTGKGFALGVASVVLRLALAQIVCNLLIAATGMGLLNVLFYLYAVMTLALFMRRTVASSAYTLKQETLVLERKLGDSTTSVVEIPLNHIIAVRPICAGERLHVCYRQVTVIDNEAKPTARACFPPVWRGRSRAAMRMTTRAMRLCLTRRIPSGARVCSARTRRCAARCVRRWVSDSVWTTGRRARR